MASPTPQYVGLRLTDLNPVQVHEFEERCVKLRELLSPMPEGLELVGADKTTTLELRFSIFAEDEWFQVELSFGKHGPDPDFSSIFTTPSTATSVGARAARYLLQSVRDVKLVPGELSIGFDKKDDGEIWVRLYRLGEESPHNGDDAGGTPGLEHPDAA